MVYSTMSEISGATPQGGAGSGTAEGGDVSHPIHLTIIMGHVRGVFMIRSSLSDHYHESLSLFIIITIHHNHSSQSFIIIPQFAIFFWGIIEFRTHPIHQLFIRLSPLLMMKMEGSPSHHRCSILKWS